MTSTTIEQNRAAVEAMYAAGCAGDIQRAASFVADDVVIVEPTYLPYGGVYHGKEEFLKIVGIVYDYLDVSKTAVHYTIAEGDRVAACIGIPDQKTGKLTHMIEESTFRDGKIAHIQLFYYDPGTMLEQPKIDVKSLRAESR